MLTSLFTGVSGMNAHMDELSVIGHNIANMNTYGFKGSRSYFADLLSQTLEGISGPNQIGAGVEMSGVIKTFTQGAFETTASPLDLALDGSGFFVMKGLDGASYYSRFGGFQMDQDGHLVDPGGMQLQGYGVDADGNLLSSLDSLQILRTSYPPQTSTSLSVAANLDSGSEWIDPATTPFDVNDLDGTTNFQTTVTVYDSLGNPRPVTLCFRKTDDLVTGNPWDWYAVIGEDDSLSGNTEIGGQGTLLFDTTGALVSQSTTTSDFSFAGGSAPNQVLAFDFGSDTTSGGSGLDGVTQYAASSGVYSLDQDGYGSGSLQGIAIDEYGTLTGSFDNGQTRTLGQIAVANFTSPSNLQSVGNNMYSESPGSGPVIVGSAGNQGMGLIRPNTLELSNVDLATEFVNMITAQRGFQANSKVVTTSDEVLAELVNLKR
jgi:flagellar hook protein FlgE